MKKLLTICTAGIMVLSSAFTSLAQSDGVINYNDTYTAGEYMEAYMPDGEVMTGTINVLNNAGFTFSIDKNSLLQNRFQEYANDYDIHMDDVWLAEIDGDYCAQSITQCPYDDDIRGIPAVNQVSDGVYNLEGLTIKPDTVYLIVVEAYGSYISKDTSSGGANAGGGGFSGYEGSFFKISSADTGSTNESSDSADNNSGNSGNGGNSGSDGDIQFFWRQDNVGWWVERSNGTYLISEWYYYPTNGLWYYMGADGYMVTNTVTPDGFTVNADGVWIP